MSAKPADPSEDYLNKILPPQEISENNQLWVRYVSATPATTFDVTNLAKDLEKQITTQEARDSGICPIREEIYAQCFDELIRQITINCAERGYLLVRVRDEVRMVTKSYQSLYDSSIAFGMKKALVATKAKTDMVERIKALEKENNSLDEKTAAMQEYIKAKTDEHEQEMARISEQHQADKAVLKSSILKSRLELDKVLSVRIN